MRAGGRLVELKEPLIVHQVLLPRKAEGDRARSSRDQNVRRLDDAATLKFETVRSCEAGMLVVGVDAFCGVVLQLFARDGPREGALELHEVAPLDVRAVRRDTVPAHAADVVHDLRTRNQHLLRIATSQGTGAAEWPVVGHCNLLPCSRHSVGRDHGGCAAADHDEVV